MRAIRSGTGREIPPPCTTVRLHDPSALTEIVYRTGPPVTVLGGTEVSVETYAGRADAEEDRLGLVFTLLLVALSAGYTGIAVVGTLLMATADRADDFRVLRRTGATTSQVLWAVAAESASWSSSARSWELSSRCRRCSGSGQA